MLPGPAPVLYRLITENGLPAGAGRVRPRCRRAGNDRTGCCSGSGAAPGGVAEYDGHGSADPAGRPSAMGWGPGARRCYFLEVNSS